MTTEPGAGLSPLLLAEILEAGADAVDYDRACITCGAEAGQGCHIIARPDQPTDRHRAREPSRDETLAGALRAMAARTRAVGNGHLPVPPGILTTERP